MKAEPAAALVLADQENGNSSRHRNGPGGWQRAARAPLPVPSHEVPVQLAVVPPGDHRCDVRVLGQHQEGTSAIGRCTCSSPDHQPSRGDQPSRWKFDLDLHRCLVPAAMNRPSTRAVLGPAFDLVGVVARGDVEPSSAGQAKWSLLGRGRGRRPLRFAGTVSLQVRRGTRRAWPVCQSGTVSSTGAGAPSSALAWLLASGNWRWQANPRSHPASRRRPAADRAARPPGATHLAHQHAEDRRTSGEGTAMGRSPGGRGAGCRG